MFHHVVLIFVPQLLFANGAILPTFIHKCSMSDPKLSECVLNQVDSVRTTIINGMPELNIPNLNPLHLSEISAPSSDKLKVKIRNMDVIGIGGTTFKDIKFDFSTFPIKVSAKVVMPEITVFGEYDVDAKLVVMQISGRGPVNATLYNFTLDVEVYFEEVVDKKHSDHLQIKSLIVKYDFQNGKIYMGNLFNGNKVLGEQTNKFINENLKDWSNEFRPAINNIIQNFLLQMLKNIVKSYSIKDTFLP